MNASDKFKSHDTVSMPRSCMYTKKAMSFWFRKSIFLGISVINVAGKSLNQQNSHSIIYSQLPLTTTLLYGFQIKHVWITESEATTSKTFPDHSYYTKVNAHSSLCKYIIKLRALRGKLRRALRLIISIKCPWKRVRVEIMVKYFYNN